MIGNRLGPYEVTARLGEGGMGEVWRATDTKLKREVAVKVLPEAFTEDRERLARFEREAQLLAQLQHPNIASIYGLEESGGTRALVMELVEGPTLAERLAQGSLPLSESLSIARQIAEALEAAHEKGIVHRDLKPQNIKASNEGTVKVLDFGLAKALDPAVSSSGGPVTASPTLMNSPTLTAAGTQLGVILGTAAYMAPEQARGQAVDKRADLWALGAVIYEMLTGRRLFEGELVSDVLASVLRQEVDWASLPPATPPALRRLLRRLLERNPRNRLHDAADVRIVLSDLEAGVADERPAEALAPARPRGREMAAWALAAAALAGLVGVALTRGGSAPAPASLRPLRATLQLPPGVTIELDGERTGMPALSPDGHAVAFGAREGSGPMRIWVLDLATGAVRALPGTEGGYRPFWSPDSRKVGFFTWGDLSVTPAGGGPVTRLAAARDARGGTWSPNGTILYAPHPYGPLLAIPESGGEPREVTRWPDPETTGTHRFPQFLPDGESFVYLERPGRLGGRQGSGVDLARHGSYDPPVRLLDGTTNAVFSDGHLLYVRDGALVAQRFDPELRALVGAPSVLVDDLLFNERFSYGVFSSIGGGLVAFLTGKQSDLSQLVWRDRSGRRLGELGTPGNISGFGGLALSPDGRWAAASRVAEGSADADLWLYDLERGTETRLARPSSDEFDPVFSPDSRTLYVGSTQEGGSRVLRRDLVSGAETELGSWDRGEDLAPMSVSPDGALLTVDLRHRSLQADLAVVPANGEGELRMLLESAADEAFGQVSPDGRWLLWSSDQSGRYELYVARFPALDSRVQVSREGGEQARWSGDGSEIFYKAPDNMLTALPVETGSGTVSVGTPVPLFRITEFYGWTYAASSDGQRFLAREPLAESEASPITLLTDWTALVDRP